MFWATIAVIGRCWWGLVRDRHALLYYYGKLLRRCPTTHPFVHLSIHILSIHRIAQASLTLNYLHPSAGITGVHQHCTHFILFFI